MRAPLLLFVLTCLASWSAALASTEKAELKPRCGGPFQLCGYVEADTDTFRIPPQFEVAQRFGDGLAAVRVNGLYGFVDQSGQMVIEPRFQAAGSFSGGYAEIRIDNASGVIDRSGRLVVPAQFRRIMHFAGDTFIVDALPEKKAHFFSEDRPLETLSDIGALTGLRAAGLYHLRKGWLTDKNLEFSLFDKPERGLIWASGKSEHREIHWGLMRADGSWQVSPRYYHVQELVETRAIVESMPDWSLPPKERRGALRRGAVDRDGNLVVPLKFGNLSYWRGGYGLGFDRKPDPGTAQREAIVRADGSLLADRYFDKVDISADGTLPRGRIGNTWYSIEASGRLIPDQRDLIQCKGGLTILRRGEEIEFLRGGDKKTIGLFDNADFAQRDCPGPFLVKRGARWFFVTEDGAVLGGEDGFDKAEGFSRGHAQVQVGGKWGIIDLSGAFTVKPQYANLRAARLDAFLVDDTYWINAAGSRVEIPVNARTDGRGVTCKGDLRFFRRGDLWGFQDQAGKTVIEPRFRALSCFEQGVSWAVAPGENEWCPIGPDGHRRKGVPCRAGYYPVVWTESNPEKIAEDPFENSVLWTRAWLAYQAGERGEAPKWIQRW